MKNTKLHMNDVRRFEDSDGLWDGYAGCECFPKSGWERNEFLQDRTLNKDPSYVSVHIGPNSLHYHWSKKGNLLAIADANGITISVYMCDSDQLTIWAWPVPFTTRRVAENVLRHLPLTEEFVRANFGLADW